MRRQVVTAILVGLVGLLPVVGSAAPVRHRQKAAADKQAGATATHATRGVVKSVDENRLVIARSGKNGGEMTFALNSSTNREGSVAAGSPVSVRYRQEGKNLIATAVTARPQPTSKSGKK